MFVKEHKHTQRQEKKIYENQKLFFENFFLKATKIAK